MKKLLLGMMVLSSVYSFAGGPVATLDCTKGEDHLISVDIASEESSEGTIAILPSSLDGLRAEISYYSPRDEKAYKYGYELALSDLLLREVDIRDYQILKKRDDNKRMIGNTLTNVAFYQNPDGDLMLNPKGAAKISIDIPQEVTVHYNGIHTNLASVIKNAATATIEYENGKTYRVSCKFKFFGE